MHRPPYTLGSSADDHRTATLGSDEVSRETRFVAEQLERVDRFRVVRKLGAGGMGMVYEAWDEKLQRRVALKFLRSEAGRESSERRFLREAQGLARISHPNVVPVYDVGRWEGRVWIAMEYVAGRTLGAWAAEAPREPAEIVRHWIAAGRGLAAIHAAGLIHRDIKPDNVLLGDDGRVRIVDFGLVKAADTLDGESSSSGPRNSESSVHSIGPETSSLDENLTVVHGFVGTPSYAAPEHWERRWVDARSDQYSLCVSLWEALCGSRPPRQERLRGGLVPLRDEQRMSKRLHLALSRGLALEPRDRFEDMPRLLAALEPPRRRWLAPAIAAGLTALVVAGAALALALDREAAARPSICGEAAAPVDGLWSESRRTALVQQLDPGLAPQAHQLIDAWAATWTAAAVESCEDAHVRHLYSGLALDRRSLCLARSLHGFDAFLQAVERGEASTAPEILEWIGPRPAPTADRGCHPGRR
jgi:eukaryotic-like serine/threonine-protein kinase